MLQGKMQGRRMIKIVYGVTIAKNHDTQEMVVGKFMGDQQIYPKTLNEVVARIMVVENEVGT